MLQDKKDKEALGMFKKQRIFKTKIVRQENSKLFQREYFSPQLTLYVHRLSCI